MAKERIRVGIIGAGWAGRAHARYYKRVPFVDVVGWADVVPGKAAERFERAPSDEEMRGLVEGRQMEPLFV